MISRLVRLVRKSRHAAARLLSAVLVAGAGMLLSSPALACQWEFAPEPIGGPSARFIMPRMFAAASFVDLALAEGSQPITPPPGSPNPPGLVAEGWSFRVVQRWKGHSADRFMLFGEKGDGRRQWDMTKWVDEKGRVYPYMSVREALVADPGQFNSCSPPSVSATPGSLHIIFREADGRLLGALPFYEDMRPVAGTSIAEVDPLWLETDWAREAHVAGAYADLWKLPTPVAVPDPGRATIRFRQPLSGSAAMTLLAETGALPFGVMLVRGERTMDYRLGSDVAMLRLVDDAVVWAQQASTPRSALIEHSKALLNAYPLVSLRPDSDHYRFAADILRLAREAEKDGPVLISAVQVIADPAVQQALARHQAVAAVVPGRRIRDRVAIEARAPSPAEVLPSPIDVHRGLAAVTGLELTAEDLAGKWRLVASFTPLEEVPLTLEFGDGQVRATMPCTDTVTSTYRVEGQVLEMTIPKPDLKACPQRHAFWTAADVFERTLFTVRLAGDRMRLLTDNGGDLEFAR